MNERLAILENSFSSVSISSCMVHELCLSDGNKEGKRAKKVSIAKSAKNLFR